MKTAKAVGPKTKSSAVRSNAGKSSGTPNAQPIALAKLYLDPKNPRFGDGLSGNPAQAAILDNIVKVYGVDDVLSSIAANGYFSSEPMIAVQEKEGAKIYVVEGNRRLAACLILTNDPRAKTQTKRIKLHARKPGTQLTSVPVMVFRTRKELLPHLGVKHIVGPQEWDGYAKAAWIARVLESDSKMNMSKIAEMIGDEHNTAARMLEGFLFIHQLIKAARFSPDNSQRSGRGSNTSYPFSWIYTILGWKTVRNWLDLSDTPSARKSPIPANRLDRAENLMDMVVGNRAKGKESVISDSRQLQDLARAIGEPKILALLQQGKSLDEVMDESRPAGDRVVKALTQADIGLQTTQLVLGSGDVDSNAARSLEPFAKTVRTRSGDVYKSIVEIMTGDNGDA